MKNLKIYVDESGDFGFVKNSSELYVVSLVLHDTTKSIKSNLNFLNEKLKSLNFNGMIHTADLIANRREYAHMKLEDRKHLFLPLFYFIYKSDICISSIIINKKYFNSKIQLRKEIKNKLIDILDNNQKYFLSFQKIIIYYDNGQEKLVNIIKAAFARYNYEIIEKFNHQEERLFQVADMLTFIDKLNYKRKEKLKINNSEKYFLSIEEYRKLIKELSRKRLKH